MRIGKLTQEQTVCYVPGQVVDPVYVFVDVVDTTKYADITSVTSWHNFGNFIGDYLFVRERIREFVSEVGFDNLSLEEKKLAVSYFVVTKAERDSVDSEEEQLSKWGVFIEYSYNCRVKRWENAKAYASFVLPPIDAFDLASSTDTLSNNYKVYGIESQAIDGVPGLFDFIESTSVYATNGFSSKPYWTQNIQDRLMSELRRS